MLAKVFPFFLLLFCECAFGESCLRNVRVAVLALPDDPMDPIGAKSIGAAFYHRQVLENLVSISGEGRITSAIAEKWVIQPDSVTYDFHISDQAMFSDGTRITALDVANSLSRPLWRKGREHNRGILGSLIEGGLSVAERALPTGIQPISANHLRIKLVRPYPPFLKIIAYSLYGIVKLDDKLERVVATSGPLEFKSLTGESITLVKSKHYKFWQKCSPDSVIFSKNKVEADVARGLAQNQFDLAFGFNEVPVADPANALPVFFGYSHLFINGKSVSFNNDEFRTNFIDIFSELLKQHSTPYLPGAHSWDLFMPPTVMGKHYYLNRKKSDRMSPEEHQKWCKKYCETPVRILIPAALEGNVALSDLQQNLSKLGLKKVSIKFPVGKELGLLFKSGDYDMTVFSYLGTYSDPDSYLSPLLGDNRLTDFMIGDLEKKVAEVKNLQAESVRKQKYVEVMKNFEEKKYFAPWQYFPVYIYKADHIKVSNSKFKYDYRLDISFNNQNMK